MALKKAKPDLTEETDSWMLTYADMVTLLFTFFVVLYSISNPDLVKLQLMSNYFSQSKKMTFTELQDKIEEFIVINKAEEKVDVSLTSKGIEISFKDKVLFGLGKADLKPEAYPILSKIGELLNYQEISDRKISIEGHTDSIPIKSPIYPSNWELSSSRAASVVKYFVYKSGLKGARFESIGYADTRPLVTDRDQLYGQPKNRRVVVVISPKSYLDDFNRKEIKINKSEKVSRKRIRNTIKKSESMKTKSAVTEKSVNNAAKANTSPVVIAPKKTTTITSTKKSAEKNIMGQYFTAGQFAFKEGNYKKAIEYWEKVLLINPNHKLSKQNIERARQNLP